MWYMSKWKCRKADKSNIASRYAICVRAHAFFPSAFFKCQPPDRSPRHHQNYNKSWRMLVMRRLTISKKRVSCKSFKVSLPLRNIVDYSIPHFSCVFLSCILTCIFLSTRVTAIIFRGYCHVVTCTRR